MQENKYYIVRYKIPRGEETVSMYYAGYNKWTGEVEQAKLFKTFKHAKNIVNNKAPGGRICELLHATLTLEDTNDLLEKELLS